MNLNFIAYIGRVLTIYSTMQSMQGKCFGTKPKHKPQFPSNPRNFSPIRIHCQNGRKFLEGQYSESTSIKCANPKTKAWKKSNYIEDQRLQTKT
jgi:hypothetical protein